MSQIEKTLRQFVADNFLLAQGGVGLAADTSFVDEGIIDSTGVLELVGFLERRYAIIVEDDELVPENLDSIRNLLGFLERKLQLVS